MLEFNEEEHRYFDGGVELPSVTTITRFCSVDSKTSAGINPFYRDRGTLVHALCADYDYTGELSTGTGVDGYLQAYADFVRDYRPQWEWIEHMVGSARQGFAGTIDRKGTIDGRGCILDIKTSSKVNKLALTAQLTGYADLTQAVDTDLWGLQLCKNGTYKVIPVEFDYEVWTSCWILHQRGQKK